MDEREKAIKGLEESIAFFRDRVTGDMYDKWLHASVDALALLKAQMPRVMTLKEYRAIAERPVEKRVPVWMEWRGGSGRWTIPARAYMLYEVTWRCWTGKPSEKEREAAKWE